MSVDRTWRTPRAALGAGFLALIIVTGSALQADTPCFPISAGTASSACLSWSHKDVLNAAPAAISGNAFSIRIVGLLPDGRTVYDRTIDTLVPPSEEPGVEDALARARAEIVAGAATPVTVSGPRLVETSSRDVTKVPLGILSSADSVSRQGFYYTGQDGASTFCVGDFGEAPGLPMVLPSTCPPGSVSVRVGYRWPLWSPPYYFYYTGFLDDTHLHMRLETHRSVLLTGTLTTLRYELTGEDPVESDADRTPTGERP